MPRDRTPEELVSTLESKGYIESQEVMDAIYGVERELFVPEEKREMAYLDQPLSIGEGQTISAPHMVALMTEKLKLKPRHKVLEIGTGSGYHAAVTAEIVGAENVYTVERHWDLAEMARQNLDAAGYGEVTVEVGDGSKGLPEYAPYDRIYLTCAAPDIPETLIEQLKIDGRMVLPVGNKAQQLVSVIKTETGIEKETHTPVRFVRLIGDEGF